MLSVSLRRGRARFPHAGCGLRLMAHAADIGTRFLRAVWELTLAQFTGRRYTSYGKDIRPVQTRSRGISRFL
jgi:hypothetical protein